jgi:hypothetical protein
LSQALAVLLWDDEYPREEPLHCHPAAVDVVADAGDVAGALSAEPDGTLKVDTGWLRPFNVRLPRFSSGVTVSTAAATRPLIRS